MMLIEYGSLSPVEIRDRIDAINDQIEDEISKAQFTLNKRIRELENELTSIQDACIHEYHNGACIHCDKKED